MNKQIGGVQAAALKAIQLTPVRFQHRRESVLNCPARVQTVHANKNPVFHRLLKRFKELTGCPVLVNTSFNVRGEPIVCTPEDAFRCFMGNELDLLVIGNCILQKAKQDEALKQDYSSVFGLD